MGKHYLWEKEPVRCEYISQQLDRALEVCPVDAALIFGSEVCAFSKTRISLFCFCDSIFGTRIDSYADQQSRHISRASIDEGILVQELALKKLTRVFISSHWAYEQALHRFNYSITTDKFEVVYIGANLAEDPAMSMTGGGDLATPCFTWVGIDWIRKGGDFAVDVIARLRERGIPAELDIIGESRSKRTDPWIRIHGRLSYERLEHYTKLQEIYARSHALLLPTIGDLTPIAISESFAFGRPVIVSPIGGIPEMVKHEVTGLILKPDSPERWADTIAEMLRTGALVKMRSACRNMYEMKLNWPVICSKMVATIKNELHNHRLEAI